MLSVTSQISGALSYLESRQLIHRDVSTRNCLVFNDYIIKLTDIAMASPIYSNYYSTESHLPVRWMPPEVLLVSFFILLYIYIFLFFKRWWKSFQIFKTFSKSELSFPKIHQMREYEPAIRRFGVTDNFEASPGEFAHQANAKDPWAASNKRSPLEQVGAGGQKKKETQQQKYKINKETPSYRKRVY